MSFQEAKAKYAKFGVDVEKALERVANIPVSLHCWQGDDVIGFDSTGALDGGIQTTGNQPGKALSYVRCRYPAEYIDISND